MYNKKTVKILIQDILISYPSTRDNDEKLAANVLHFFLLKRNVDSKNISANKLLEMYSQGQLPTIDYITRIRRKLQELNPDIRGNNYNIRQSKSKKVKENINTKPIDKVL